MKRTLLAMAAAAGVLLTQNAFAQQGDIAKYCKPDIERLCAGIQPGGGRLLQCLKAHPKEISVGCGQALQKLKG